MTTIKIRLLQTIRRGLKAEIKISRKRWEDGLGDPIRRWHILYASIAFIVLFGWAFNQGTWFGVSFLAASIFSVIQGHIFTHPYRIILVAVATVIIVLVIPDLRGDVWQVIHEKNGIVAALLITAIIFAFHKVSQYLKTEPLDD